MKSKTESLPSKYHINSLVELHAVHSKPIASLGHQNGVTPAIPTQTLLSATLKSNLHETKLKQLFVLQKLAKSSKSTGKLDNSFNSVHSKSKRANKSHQGIAKAR